MCVDMSSKGDDEETAHNCNNHAQDTYSKPHEHLLCTELAFLSLTLLSPPF